jgi:hypothetical protein
MRVTLAALMLIGHFALTLIGLFAFGLFAFTLIGLLAFGLFAFMTPPARTSDHRQIVPAGSWLRTSFGATRGPVAVVTESLVGPSPVSKLDLLLASQTFGCLARSAYELAFAGRHGVKILKVFMRVTMVTLTLFGILGILAATASATPPARIFGQRQIRPSGSWLRTSFGATRGPAAIFTELRVVRRVPHSWKLASLLAFQTFVVTTIVAHPPRRIGLIELVTQSRCCPPLVTHCFITLVRNGDLAIDAHLFLPCPCSIGCDITSRASCHMELSIPQPFVQIRFQETTGRPYLFTSLT